MTDAQVTFQNEAYETAEPGKEFFFSFVCPNRRNCDLLRLRNGTPKSDGGHPTWGWDGNREKPTFHPSINHAKCWHGYIREGRCVDVQGNEEPERPGT